MKRVLIFVVVLMMMLVGCGTKKKPSLIYTVIIDKPEHYLRISDDIFLVAYKNGYETIEENGNRRTEKQGDAMVTNKYIITSRGVSEFYDLKEGEPSYNRTKTMELKISLYTSDSEMEHIKDIDVLKLIEEQIDEVYTEKRVIFLGVSEPLKEIDDRTYVMIDMLNLDDERKEEVKKHIYLYLDVESDKLYFEEELNFAGKEENYYYNVFDLNLYTELPKYGLQVARANLQAEAVAIYNVFINGYRGNGEEKLFEVYPEVLEYFMLRETRTSMYFYNSDPEEVARLIIEGDLYYNRTLKAEHSKDGEEHDIRSISDFLEWYDYYGGSRDGQ